MPNSEDMKQRIRDGEILIGVSVPLNATKSQMEDIISKDDYAFVHTDSQHGPFNEETLVQYLRVRRRARHPRRSSASSTPATHTSSATSSTSGRRASKCRR